MRALHRLLPVVALGAVTLLGGCVAYPSQPAYYAPGYAPGYYSAPAYVAPAYPAYVAPSVSLGFGWGGGWHHGWR